MAYKLKDNPARRYTSSEQRMFSLLGTQPQSTIELGLAYYKSHEQRPIYMRETAIQILHSLSRKMEINHESYRLVRTRRRGPIPMEWCLEPRIFSPTIVRARLKAMKAKVEAV